jgi:hypothetical protein
MTLKISSLTPLVRFLAVVAGLIVVASCGGGSSSSTSSTPPPPTTNNSVDVTVNLGPTGDYVNGIFTSVQVCAPGSTTNCVTVPDVLVDTGSNGLRLLSSALGSLSLPAVTDSSGNDVQECTQFISLDYIWGPVVQADIHLSGETASAAAINVISESPQYPVPASCLTLGIGGADDNSVAALGANGILGVGNFPTDCTFSCTSAGNCTTPCTSASNEVPYYYSCPNGNCQITSVLLSGIVANPVALFAQDNNGVLISLPTIPAGGQATASGSLIFGIGTQSNNALGSAQIYAAEAGAYFTTTYNGASYSNSFIDSGSNTLDFLDYATLGTIECTDNFGNPTGFYCPPSTLNFTVTNSGTNGTSGSVSFSIANADSLFNTGFAAFNDLGGDSGTSPSTDYFDFGLPFFFGRNVFTGIAGTTVPNGVSVPYGYWAY